MDDHLPLPFVRDTIRYARVSERLIAVIADVQALAASMKLLAQLAEDTLESELSDAADNLGRVMHALERAGAKTDRLFNEQVSAQNSPTMKEVPHA